jgi:histidinol dehydrogenase
VSDDSVNQRVLDIIKAVRERGDAALVEFTQRSTASTSSPWPT